MIILEGPDRCGKSTVALHLRDHHGLSYRHTTKPPVACYRYLMWQLVDSHPRMVWDRLHWGELAYGLTYRSRVELTPHQWRLLELCCLTLGAVVIHLTDEPEAIRGRWSAEEMWPGWGIEGLVEQYRALAAGESYPRSYLPSATFTLPELVQAGQPTTELHRLVQLARERELAATLLPPLPPPSLFLGSADAEFLVIGEAPCPSAPPSDKQGSVPDLPLSRGPAADWFWRAADEVGLHWHRGAFTNASTYDCASGSPWEFRSVRQALRQVRTVVCLGERAAKLVHQQQRDGWHVSCTHIWHPSYIKIYRHREFPQWKDELAVALAPWGENAHLALDSGGYPDGSEATIEAHRPGCGVLCPQVQAKLEPDTKPRTCLGCRGRGFLCEEDKDPSDWKPCPSCDAQGYVLRGAS